MREFLGPEAYTSRLEFLDRVAAGEQVSFNARVPHLDGSWRDAAIRYAPKRGPGGFEGVYILVFDIAAHEQRFHSVFDGTAVGFWKIDLAQAEELLAGLGARDTEELVGMVAADPGIVRQMLAVTPVLNMNAKAAEMFGVDPHQVRGEPLGGWCPDASLPTFTASLIAFLSGATSFQCETVMTGADGRAVHVLLTCAFAKNAPGEKSMIVGTTDISARIAKEQELARAQADLAHAARVATLGELMASIAHEVNQPLTAIVINGNAAMRWLNRPEPNPFEAKEAVLQMVSEATRASDIIARTRAMAVKGSGTRSVFSVNAMLEDTIALVARQVSTLGAELQLQLTCGLPEIYADRIQLQQVAINLVMNAAQAMSDQPEGSRQIAIRSSLIGEQIAVEVADTGPGIHHDDPQQIFTDFYSTKATGMGMGLSVSRTIVEAHRGAIAFRSPPGGGALFVFTVPIATDQAAAEAMA